MMEWSERISCKQQVTFSPWSKIKEQLIKKGEGDSFSSRPTYRMLLLVRHGADVYQSINLAAIAAASK